MINTADRKQKKLRKEINELLEKDEIRWKQRSRVMWLREGDRKTNYFHRTATWRQKKNKIEKLNLPDGSSIVDTDKMEKHATDFFCDLFTADNSVRPLPATELFQQKIDEDMNISLCAPFTDEEISFALFQIGPTKAPWPNGFPSCFFQRNWGTLETDIITEVTFFLRMELCQME